MKFYRLQDYMGRQKSYYIMFLISLKPIQNVLADSRLVDVDIVLEPHHERIYATNDGNNSQESNAEFSPYL